MVVIVVNSLENKTKGGAMIIWVKKETVFSDCDQRAVVENVVEREDGIPIIFIQLIETNDEFIIQSEDIVGVEINESLIVRFGHFEFKSKEKKKKKTIRKIIRGSVVQTFVDGKCIRQQFVVDDDVVDHFTYDNYVGIKDPGKDLLELYHHSNMVQP